MTAPELLAVPTPPADDAPIWRYMDFTKFVAILENRALFFPRVSGLDDPFEGSFPQGQTPIERVKAMLGIVEIPDGIAINFSPGLEDAWSSFRKWSFVSCWYAAEYESAAMWRLYASTGAAVAVRTTVGALRKALGKPPALGNGFMGSDAFHIGSIEYIDYSSDKFRFAVFSQAPVVRA